MSLLAEPRRRQIISVNPQGKNFVSEWQTFGKRLMGKYGWEDGDGLGAARQGNTDFVQVLFKDDNLGVGCTMEHEQNWLAHGQDFNALLAALNQNYGETSPTKSVREDSPVEAEAKTKTSLESKSKSSKGRIHYHKFVKGKDLSSRSINDISSIFGGKLPTQETSTVEVEESQEVEKSSSECHITGLNTVVSSDNIHEYFRKKMQAKKLVSSTGTEKTREKSSVSEIEQEPVVNEEVFKPKKKSKRTKEELTDALSVIPIELETVDLEASGEKKRKKRKRKSDSNEDVFDQLEEIQTERDQVMETATTKEPSEEATSLNISPAVANEVETRPLFEEIITEKKTKKKKKRNQEVSDTETSKTTEVLQFEDPVSEPIMIDTVVRKSVVESPTRTTQVVQAFVRGSTGSTMMAIKQYFAGWSPEQKESIFPGSNVFEIAGYGNEGLY